MTNVPNKAIRTSSVEDAAEAVHAFIVTNFLFGDASGLTDGASLIDGGVVDSTGIVELVSFLEERFAICVEDADMVPENLDSIASIAAFVVRKSAG